MESSGAHGVRPKGSDRGLAGLWRSWMEAHEELPLLRWLGLAAFATAELAVFLTARDDGGYVDMAAAIAVLLLLILTFPVMVNLLTDIQRWIWPSRRVDGVPHAVPTPLGPLGGIRSQQGSIEVPNDGKRR